MDSVSEGDDEVNAGAASRIRLHHRRLCSYRSFQNADAGTMDAESWSERLTSASTSSAVVQRQQRVLSDLQRLTSG
ncbi:hypothetical protein CesoFtcFv8_021387 [Champsocephalus esox]|uniref:Uncharacterized protein n=1 Tax=Champsocephalus esox TaxID=159716 RepID=A0AAN8BDH6_9TELE|nr:hypothetical protein CesoFtcFv8_021387 [Champsocephalus esox]